MALGVQADCRRSGIGDALASRAVSDAEKPGIVTLRLTVEPTNHGAIALYKRRGFEPQEVTIDYFGRGEDRQVMRRQAPVPDRRNPSLSA
jgi:ribosomal protein S18 acetylase RimI-like enzyme